MCETLPTIQNGVIQYQMDDDEMAPYDHGVIATYSCKVGYSLSGDAMRVCREHNGTMGAWNGTEPTCMSKLEFPLSFFNKP